MGFSTKECAWSHVSLKLLGRTLVGLRGFELGKTKEKEYLYGAGNKPIDIQEGNVAYPGSIKLLKYEVDLLNEAAQAAGYEDFLEVPHDLIVLTCNFKKTATDKAKTITVTGIAFNEDKVAMEQNAKYTEQTLTFMSMQRVLS